MAEAYHKIKLQKLLNIYTQHTTYIMGWEHEEEQAYYINPETAKLAQEIHDDPELRILMDASRDLEPEDIKFVVDLVKKLKLKERGDHAD